MGNFFSWCCLALFLLAESSILHAVLVWGNTSVLVKDVSIGQDAVSAQFHFINEGSSAVSLSVEKPGCKCVTYDLPAVSFGPGESGVINVRFQIEGRQGEQAQSLRVRTSDSDKETVLSIKAFVPSILDFNPRVVFWTVGEEAIEKEIQISVPLGEAIKVIRASADGDSLRMRMVVVEAEKTLKLFVRPASTTKPTRGRISILVRLPSGMEKTLHAYAHVRVKN